MTGFRLTIDRRFAGGRQSEVRSLLLATRAQLEEAMAVIKDFIVQAKRNTECRAVTLVLHLPDCDHEP